MRYTTRAAFFCLFLMAPPLVATPQEICTPTFVAENSNLLPSGFDISEETDWQAIVEENLGCFVDGQNLESEGWPLQLTIEGILVGSYGGLFFDVEANNTVAAFRVDPDTVAVEIDGPLVAFYDLNALRATDLAWTAPSADSSLLSSEDFAFSGMRFFPYEQLIGTDEVRANNAIAASLVLGQRTRFSFSSTPTNATVFVANDVFETDRIKGYAEHEVGQVRMSLDGFNDCIITPDQFGEDWQNAQRIVHCVFDD